MTLFSIKGIIEGTAEVTIYDLQGRIIFTTTIASNSAINTVNLGDIDLAEGYYVVEISELNLRKKKRRKIIRKKRK